MNQPRISVVIPAYNAERAIGRCLTAVQNQTYPSLLYEIIVVDDGSTDNTASLVVESGATLIQHPHKRGAAAARNSGVAAAQGEIICFTDADCEPDPNWIEAISAPLRADPDIIGAKGVYGSRQPELTARFVQIEYEDKYDLLRAEPRINFIDTYSAAYKRDVLQANNGFDENIFFVEDQELSFRLAARGYQMVFQPEARVYHLHSDTLLKYGRKKFAIGYWKSQIIRRFPDRAIKDSHTPQVMKAQIGLAGLILALAAASPLFAWALYPLAAAALAFLLTTPPFTHKAWAKDRAVALAAPPLLFLRAVALGMGYGWGLIRPQPGMSGQEDTIGGLNYLGKRALDIAGALLGLTFTLLVGPFLALAIRLSSPGPILFRQERIGQGGRPFTIYKFRSMKPGAEEELSRLIDLDSLPEPAFKLENDPRITPVGRFLRRWSMDELPQFWNVLKGDMSLIGPRPEESQVVARYSDWHRRRLAIKPGITGPMQVHGRGDLSLDKRVKLELDYIENYSLWRDIKILLRTIPAVLRGDGAR